VEISGWENCHIPVGVGMVFVRRSPPQMQKPCQSGITE